MIWSNAKLSPEVCSLLDSERGIAVLPAAARGRAVSRARAALAATVATQARRPLPSRATSSVRWAAAGGAGLGAPVGGGGGGGGGRGAGGGQPGRVYDWPPVTAAGRRSAVC